MQESFKQRMVRECEEALSLAVRMEDYSKLDAFCRKYEIRSWDPVERERPIVRLVMVCDAALQLTNIPEDVKAIARRKLDALGIERQE